MKIDSFLPILNEGQNRGWARGISRSAWASGVRGHRESVWRTRLRASSADRTSRGMRTLDAGGHQALVTIAELSTIRSAAIYRPASAGRQGGALQRLRRDAI